MTSARRGDYDAIREPSQILESRFHEAYDAPEPLLRSGRWSTQILRFFRLQVLNRALPWHQETENNKVVSHATRGRAILHAFIHVLPVSCALALMGVNIRGFFVGNVDSTAITALQFAAKGIEVLLQASLAAMFLAYVREKVIGPDPVPFGCLFGPYETTFVSYLWSIEFWGAMTSRWGKKSDRILFGILTFSTILLAALAGPSSAILLIPRRGNYPSLSALWLAENQTGLFPNTMTISEDGSILDSTGISGFMESSFTQTIFQLITPFIAHDETPSVLTVVDSYGIRLLHSNYNITDAGPGYNESFSTVPLQMIANLHTLFNAEGYCEAQTLQPVVQVSCWTSQFPDADSGQSYVDFGPGYPTLNSFVPVSLLGRLNSTADSADTVIESVGLSSGNAMIYQSPPSSMQNVSVLMVVVSSSAYNYPGQGSSLSACVINAAWGALSSTLTLTSAGYQTVTKDPHSSYSQSGILGETISIPPEFIRKVNNMTLESGMESLVGISNSITNFTGPALALAISNYPQVAGMQIVNQTLADDGFLTSQQNETLIEAARKMPGRLWYSAQSYNGEDFVDWTNISQLAHIQLQPYRAGYSYNLFDLTAKLAIALLSVYVLGAALYLAWIVSTGRTATSWATLSELVALALNSHPSTVLQNTSVGIDAPTVFREPINVRVNEAKTCELVFDACERKSQRRYTEVEPNKRY